jgi:Transposase domain (DUF772)/Transposase DDE domain
MFKKNKRHLQPPLLSNVTQLPEKHRLRLENSWAGVYYREVFCRINEDLFAVLYADFPSRPNIPVNVLVGLEFLKAGFGWSDEELYDAFNYNLQVRYALGYHEFGEGDFDLRTLYYFRERLSRYMQEKGVNLLAQAFEQMTDQQIAAFQLKTGLQRMDSTQVASNIQEMCRLQFLVEVLQRVHRMLDEVDQARYAEVFAPYLRGSSGQYLYRLKKGDFWPRLHEIGACMDQLRRVLKERYEKQTTFQMLERVFAEHFRVAEEQVQGLSDPELSPTRMLSPDDWDATLRGRRNTLYQGYVANLTETCDPQNPFQLITQVQVAPNHVDDPKLLLEALPNLKERTGLDTLYTDGGFGSPAGDQAMQDLKVQHIPTAIRGPKPLPGLLHLWDFAVECDENGHPTQMQCPQGQQVAVAYGNQKKGFVACFDQNLCSPCPFQQSGQCPAKPFRKNPTPRIYFLKKELQAALRRQRMQASFKQNHNLRTAIEATCRAVKCRYPQGKFPVRGLFRMSYLLICSAVMNNVRRMDRYRQALQKEARLESAVQKDRNALSVQTDFSFSSIYCRWLQASKVAFRHSLLRLDC